MNPPSASQHARVSSADPDWGSTRHCEIAKLRNAKLISGVSLKSATGEAPSTEQRGRQGEEEERGARGTAARVAGTAITGRVRLVVGEAALAAVRAVEVAARRVGLHVRVPGPRGDSGVRALTRGGVAGRRVGVLGLLGVKTLG